MKSTQATNKIQYEKNIKAARDSTKRCHAMDILSWDQPVKKIVKHECYNSITSRFPDIGDACKWLCSHFLVLMCCNLIIVPLLIVSPCFADVPGWGLTICQWETRYNCKPTPTFLGGSDDNFLLERIRRQRREIYPVAIGIINIWKSCDRLLPTARTIGHVMGMQTKFSFLVH